MPSCNRAVRKQRSPPYTTHSVSDIINKGLPLSLFRTRASLLSSRFRGAFPVEEVILKCTNKDKVDTILAQGPRRVPREMVRRMGGGLDGGSAQWRVRSKGLRASHSSLLFMTVEPKWK